MVDAPANGLPPGCPLDVLLRFLARAWMAHILWSLSQGGSLRFGELRRAVPGEVSARVLATRLQELMALGLVRRQAAGAPPRAASYALTNEGARLSGVLRGMEELAEAAPLPAALAPRSR